MINIIPKTIDRLIVLDVDLLVLEDLSNLWHEVDRNPGKYLYMVNESYNDKGFYSKLSKKKHFLQPYGVSLGVMVADLRLLRKDKLNGKESKLLLLSLI